MNDLKCDVVGCDRIAVMVRITELGRSEDFLCYRCWAALRVRNPHEGDCYRSLRSNDAEDGMDSDGGISDG
jgi:hypothetical protein